METKKLNMISKSKKLNIYISNKINVEQKNENVFNLSNKINILIKNKRKNKGKKTNDGTDVN